MSFDFYRRDGSFALYFPYDISRIYLENILDDYQHAWDVNNESVIRSCEQKLIKLDKKTLVGYLHQFFRKPSKSEEFFLFIIQTKNKYALCVLIHLIRVFCIPGQEEKIKVVQVELNEVLRYLAEEDRFDIFERYISQRLKAKPNLTEIDLLTGQIDPQHKFHLKLCYWDIIVWTKNNTEGCKDFLKKNAQFLVSNIEEILATIDPQRSTWRLHKMISISCKILLCLLNWNICKIQTQGILHNRELSAVTYSYTAYQLTNILQKLLMLTDDYISTIFKDYNNHVMNYGKTPEGLCISETVSNHEFQLKFCNWNGISSKNDHEAYKKFIQLYPEFLVSYIEELVVQQHETKTTISPCKTLLCILNWNVFHQKTSTPEVKKSTRHQYTAYKVSSILQKLLLILSEDEIFKASNDYLEQMYAMNSEITEDDFCTGKIEPYYEFLLKLCYCKKLMNENDDDERCKEFLTRNADLFVSQIEEVVHGNKITKLASCKILLHLLNWNICDQKSTLTQSKIPNNAIQEQCSLQSEERNTTKESCTMYKVRCVLQNLLYTLTEDDITEVFNDYMDQMYAIKSEITPDGLCIGEKESHHEFKLKLCYWRTICRKNDYKGYKKFIQLYPEFLVSHIKERIVFCQGTKTKQFYFKTLLCILTWASTSVDIIDDSPPKLISRHVKMNIVIIDDSPPKYYCTEVTIRDILQILLILSSFSEEEIFTAFNNYLDILYTMNSEITEADFCTGKIEPYQEFMMKLCYCEKLWHKKDEETYKNFLTRNAEFLVSKIKEVVDKKNTKTQVISCQVLLCLLKWDICSGKTVYIPPKNILSQMLAQNCQNFMNENAEVFISMKHTKIKRNNIPVLIILCDVLLRIPYNTCHFHDVTGAINKLIRYYAAQVGIDERICEWIILFGHRLLKYTKHTQDIHNHIAAKEIHYDFQMLKNFLKDLFTEAIHVGTNFYLLINAFRKETNLYGNYDILNAEDGHINKLWRAKLICKVKIIQISNIRKKNKNLPFEIDENKNCLEFDFAKLSVIDTFEKEVKEDQLKVKNLEDQINAILIIDEMVKKFQLSEMLVLLLMLLIAGTSNGHHKSAKLKKYLTLKYEYDKASLYLLWCSGDIEVHPGPSLNKKSLVHDSSIERRWIKNISPKIVVLLPEHEQSKYKPTKKVRNDSENRECFKLILKTCQEEQVHVPKLYLAEINAWETQEYQLLNKLFVYRYEIETIITSLQDFFIHGGSTNDLTDINISFHTELLTNEIAILLGKDQRPKDKSQLMAYITGKIANILIKCAHGEDPDAKHDGLWDLFLKNWPTDIILFDPNNKEKFSKKNPGQKLIRDQELVDILLTLPQVTIPQKYKAIIDAFRTMRKSQKDKSINKQHKAELCRTFKRIYSLEKLDDALKKLWESGIFTKEVHNNLNKWWTTGAVDTTDDQNFPQDDIKDAQKKGRPHILMNISTKYMTLTVEQTDANISQVSYEFPFSDELVSLKTKTTIRKPSIDSYQKVTAKKHFKVSPKQDACPTDNQTNLIIIPPEALKVLNTLFPCHLYPDSQAILENDIKHQHEMSSQETALCSIHLDQPTFSTNQFIQWNQNIATAVQPGPILCTPNQLKTNSDDISSATKDSQNLDCHAKVSTTSDLGSSSSISSVNSKSGNDDGDQNNILNGSQVLLTDSDYISDSSNNCVSKTNMKKRKCMEEDRNEMKKRKIPSSKQDKKPKETNHRKMDSSMDKSTIFNTNMELLQNCLQIDLDMFVFDDKNFDVKLNAPNNEDKNPQICDKDGNLMNCETQMSNENTNISAYNTSVSTILEKFVKDMINEEHEKMSQMKTSLSEV